MKPSDGPSDRLQADRIGVRRGRAVLLHEVSVLARPGEFLAICGPNGAGKSTLLAVLAGSLLPSAGTVRLDGLPLPRWHPVGLAARRAVLGQQSTLLFGFQVAEVVALGRVPHRGSPQAARDAPIVREAMGVTGVQHLATRNFLSLSGGERQRVQLARVLAQVWEPVAPGRSQWLLLDEPTAALDLRYQIALMRILRQCADRGWGVIAVLHDLPLVRRWADRCLLLRRGELAAAGSAASVLQPARVAAVYEVAQEDLAEVLPVIGTEYPDIGDNAVKLS